MLKNLDELGYAVGGSNHAADYGMPQKDIDLFSQVYKSTKIYKRLKNLKNLLI